MNAHLGIDMCLPPPYRLPSWRLQTTNMYQFVHFGSVKQITEMKMRHITKVALKGGAKRFAARPVG